jgi:mycothiol synthase
VTPAEVPEVATPVEWGADRLGDLVALCGVALPDESISADDLESLCFGPGSDDSDGALGTTVVLGVDDIACLILSLRRSGGRTAAPTAFVQLLAVHPARRRRGLGRSLVEAAERWAHSRGATAVLVGAGAPVYLFTGVDSRWTEALCCFEALGYQRIAVEFDLACPTLGVTREAVPPGVRIEPVTSDEQVSELVEWSERYWPAWVPEFERAGQAGTVTVARSVVIDERGREVAGALIGAAAHSVGRVGVVGPVAVQPDRHAGGIGTALMAAVLRELSVAGLHRAEIAWVSTIRFYARSCGARVERASQVLRRELSAPRSG